MARTKGSGWGGAPIKWRICPKCGRKKAMIKNIDICTYLKCTWHKCKEWTKI